jgi:drug/metabolite transporter (DMT)-like permease
MTGLVVLFSLAAAACLALATVLQQQAAATVPKRHALRPSIIVAVLRKPRWLAGKVADVAALVLQALALARGSLLVVQPLLAFGVVIAMPMHAWTAHRRLGSRQYAGAVATAAGLAVFLLAGRPTAGRHHAGMVPWALGVLVAGLAAVVCVVAASGLGRHARAALYAGAGGCCFAISGACLKQVSGEAFHLTRLVTDPAWIGFLAIGALGTVFVQSAFQAGPLTSSIGVLTAAEPVMAAVVGALVFDERFRGGPGALAIAGGGAVLLAIGVLAVASFGHQPAEQPAAFEQSDPRDRSGRDVARGPQVARLAVAAREVDDVLRGIA